MQDKTKPCIHFWAERGKICCKHCTRAKGPCDRQETLRRTLQNTKFLRDMLYVALKQLRNEKFCNNSFNLFSVSLLIR